MTKVCSTGCFFDCSALKMTKCQPAREISALFHPKKGLRMKKLKCQNCSELFIYTKRPRKNFK